MKTTPKTTLLSLLALALAATPQARAISDSFANATVITTSNGDAGAANLMNCTSEAGEPGHKSNGGLGAQKSAWWRWTASSNGFCTVDTIVTDDDDFVRDTLVSVYTGATVGTLTRIVANDDHNLILSYAANRAASATFYAIQGTTYHIAVDGYGASAVNANNSKARLRLRFLAATPESRIGTFGYSGEPGLHGSVQLSKTAGHAFTAKLMLAGKAYPFSGVFSQDGYFTVSFERKVPAGSPPLPPFTLLLDGAQNGDFDFVSTISGDTGNEFSTVQRFTGLQPSSMKGLYTAGIATSGSLSLKISPLGVATGVAVMPDGTKATFGSAQCWRNATSSHVPTYTSLHANAGYFTSYLRITEAGAVDQLEKDFSNYLRPAKAGAVFYPAGLNLYPTITGSTYVVPALGARALGFLDASMGAGKLSITMQNPEINPAITENLTLDTKNIFKFATPQVRKPVLTLNKTTGLVTGGILDQGGKKRTLTGILYRFNNTTYLRGQLSGSTLNPVFEVIP